MRAVVLVGVVLCAGPAIADPAVHPLRAPEARKWIAAAKLQKIGDGATILQALKNAERLRPHKFKFGKFAVGYNGEDGKPDAVMVETWIGSKRLPDDANTIMIPIKRAGDKLQVKIPHASGLFLDGLRKGQDALLTAIDEQYQDVCVENRTHAKLC